MVMRSLLMVSVLLVFAGFGTYRAWRYGTGSRRHFGLIPPALLVTAVFLVPLVLGALQRAGLPPVVAGMGPNEFVIVTVIASLLLAAISGAVLVFVFRPKKR